MLVLRKIMTSTISSVNTAPEDSTTGNQTPQGLVGVCFVFFFFLDLCFVQMKSPEVGIAHREKVSQESLVKMPLGRSNSPSSFFSVPWPFLWTQTMYFYNCSSLKSLRTENRRAGWRRHYYFFASPESPGTGTDELTHLDVVQDAGFPPDTLSFSASFLFPFLPYLSPSFLFLPFIFPLFFPSSTSGPS